MTAPAASVNVTDMGVIDTDTHVTESPDLWTSRVPKRWRDEVPRVDSRPDRPGRFWRLGEHWLTSVAAYSRAGWPHLPPQSPTQLDEVDPGTWRPTDRLKRMDEYGVRVHLLHPNLLGRETQHFMRLEPELALACVSAYNDFVTDFVQADRSRLIPVAVLPFWNVDASVAEMRRVRERGHRAVLFANDYPSFGLPHFTDHHWDPIYDAAQNLQLPIHRHAGFFAQRDQPAAQAGLVDREYDPAADARNSSISLMSGATWLAELLTSDLLDRFPRLKFVSIESGVGYVNYLLESLDWNWKILGAFRKRPSLPSEYFRRQCYATFWFEDQTMRLLDTYPGNFMFETDYPHRNSVSPGPASPAERPADYLQRVLTDIDPGVAKRVVHDNAAELYGLND